MAQQLKVKSNAQKRQERLVILMAVGTVVASVMTTLYVSGFFSRSTGESGASYHNITFTDAVISCKEQTRSDYKGVLRSLTLDDHSSRFDQGENLYKIFFNAKMQSNKSDSGEGEFFINCYVDGGQGRIAGFEVYEDKEVATEVLRKNDGGLFGWPLKK